MAKIKLVPTGSMTTKNGNKLYFYFITSGPVKNISVATGAPMEVELLNEVKPDKE